MALCPADIVDTCHGNVISASVAARRFIHDCAAAIKAVARGKVALYLGGQALLAQGILIDIGAVCVLAAAAGYFSKFHPPVVLTR